MSLLDSAIEYLNPERGLHRRQAKLKLDLLKRKYEGASTSERFSGWTPLTQTGSAQDSHALDLMAGRVGYLYDNTPAVKRGINAIANYTFGAGCIPSAVKPDGKKHENLEAILKDFYDTPACDLEERETLYSKQIQAGIHVPRDGSFLIQRVWLKDNNSPLPFKLKCITQDYIDKSKNKVGNYGRRIVQGIEYDGKGRRIAIWLHENKPNKFIPSDIQSKRIDMRDICHPFRTTVAGQTHGVTWGAPIIVRAKDFDEYLDAQLVRQKISSAFVGLVHDIEGGNDVSNSPMEGKITPGTWMMAPEGKTVEFSSPPQVEGLSEYVKIQNLGISSGLEVPYMIVASDFSDSNYTQSRMTILDFARQIESYQQHIFYPQMLHKIGMWTIEGYELSGYRTNTSKILWTFPRREFVDPEKDMNAFILGVQNGFISWEQACREMGNDPEDVAKSIQSSKLTLGAVGIQYQPTLSQQIEKEANDAAKSA